MPSCFLKRHIWLAKVFQKFRSPPSKGFLDLTPHKFQSTTQKSEQKNFKLFLLWLLLLLSHIHLLQLLSCSNLLQEPWSNHKDCFSFLGYVITFLQFFWQADVLFVLLDLASTCLGAGAGVDFKVFPMAICSCIVNPPLSDKWHYVTIINDVLEILPRTSRRGLWWLRSTRTT